MSTPAFVAMTTETCWVCGISFSAPERWLARRDVDGSTFWCPAGCKLRYGKGKLAQAREETARAEKQLAASRARNDQLSCEVDHQTRSASAYKGQVTKQKKRAAAGVCPCCQRTFKQLAAHMTAKHPDHAS